MGDEDRQKRLAAALRDNLRKRKARARDEPVLAPEPSATPPHTPQD